MTTAASTPGFADGPVPPLNIRLRSDVVGTDYALDLFVPGKPAPQGSKGHVGNGVLVESSKALAPWRTTVAWHAAQVYRSAPLAGPLTVRVEFVMPRPKALPKRLPTPPHIKRPDTDKLIRAVLDALTGVVWRDDSQINDLHPTKRYAELDEQPGANIRVRPSQL